MIRRRVELSGGWAEASLTGSIRIGDRLVPRSINAHFEGVDGQPALDLLIEVRNGLPECVDLRISAVDGGRGVRQLDLAAVKVNQFVQDITAALAMVVVDESQGSVRVRPSVNDGDLLDSVEALGRARIGKGARTINTAFLRQVATVYRDNIAGNPTQSVARAFSVGQRAASGYVQRARHAGLLAETTPGKKGI